MPVLLLIVGLAVLVAAVYVALGRGGELSRERADYAPLDLGPVSAADVALLRPPSNGWGYNKQATDEALDRIAESVRERDVRIVALEQLVTDLSRDPAPVALGDPLPGARHRRAVETPAPRALTGAGNATEPESLRGAGPEPDAAVEAPAAEPEQAAQPEKPEQTTLPQPAVPSVPGIWPTTPEAWPTAPAVAEAAAEQTTQPQPAIRETSGQPEERLADRPEAQPGQQQRLRSTGEPASEQQRHDPPPERSHG